MSCVTKEVFTKVGMKQLQSDEYVFVRYDNIIGNPLLNVEDILESVPFRTTPVVPAHKHERVFKQC